jgi:drug/metabolite transporter (DMT)-like permease
VIAAVVILGASLVPLQIVAIALLLVGAALLGIYDHPGQSAVGRAWLAPMLLAIACWGAWGIVEKLAINALGFAGNAGIYVIVSTPLYLAIARPGLRDGGSWDRVGTREALPSLLLFGVAGIAIYLAVGLGPIAVVVPLTTAYPVVAILVRRFWMEERMTRPQKVAVVLAFLGACLASL